MRYALLVFALVAALSAAADQPSTAIPPSISDTTVPALSCIQPDLSDISKLNTKDFKALQVNIKAYGDCLQQYIDDRHKKAGIYVTLQKAEVDAGNAAVTTINAFFAQVREIQNKQNAKATSKAKSQ
jgi:hypothetical protein